MTIPTEREDDELKSRLDTMRSHVRNHNLETQEAESLIIKDTDRYTDDLKRWGATWTMDGLSKGRTLESRLLKLEHSEGEDFGESPIKYLTMGTDRDLTSQQSPENFETKSDTLQKKVTWGKKS